MGWRMMDRKTAGTPWARARVAVVALAAALAAGCNNPLVNLVKDVALGNTADLSGLTIVAGTSEVRLSPGFSPSILEYRALVDRATTQVTVKPVKADADAVVAVNDAAADSDGVDIALTTGGESVVTIEVVSASGLQKNTYTVRVSRGIVRQLAGGAEVNILVTGDGSVWTWGANTLGDGTFVGRDVPAWVSGISGITSVSTSYYHILALKEDGTVWSWGGNWGGQLGDGTTWDRSVPGQVVGAAGALSLGDMKAVAAGWDHSLALKNDGTVWAWGANWSGQLGDNTTTNRSVPARVQGGLTTVKAIAAGDQFSLAVKEDGTVWAWGRNGTGQLGDNSTTDRTLPVQVATITGVKAIAAGADFGMALLSDGTVWTWGGNGEGQLGDGTTTMKTAPAQVPGLTGVQAIAASWSHAVALKTDQNVLVWGSNWRGQIGNGTITMQLTPSVVSGLAPAVMIGAGAECVFALTTLDEVWWWGSPYYAPSSIAKTPVQVGGLSSVTAASAAGGAGHTAVLAGSGAVYTCGDNYLGQLGFAGIYDVTTATVVSALSGVGQVSAGAMHTVARKADGTIVWAWGANWYGQLGDGTTTNRNSPVSVGFPSNAIGIAAGYNHSLAVLNTGAVYAWGQNWQGQLGNNSTTDSATPVLVSSVSAATAVAAGERHSLALLSTGGGTVAVWGWNADGQLGDGGYADRKIPYTLPGFSSVTAVAAGGRFSLALKGDGTVWGWGANWNGQLGDGTWISRISPVQVKGLTGVTAIAAGELHGLARKSDGTVWTWGSNRCGQLGNGTLLSTNVPVQVTGLTGVTAVEAGNSFSLAVKSDGTAWAWGSGESGQLGNGSIAFKFVPAKLAWP